MLWDVLDVKLLAHAILGSSPAVLFPVLCVSKRLRASALEVLANCLRGTGESKATVRWFLVDVFNDTAVSRSKLLDVGPRKMCCKLNAARVAWAQADLPPWRVLMHTRKREFSLCEWSNLKDRVLRAVEATTKLPSVSLGTAATAAAGLSVPALLRLHLAVQDLAQGISEELAGSIGLQDIGAPTQLGVVYDANRLLAVYHADRVQLPEAIRDLGRQALDLLDRQLRRALVHLLRQASAGSAWSFAADLKTAVDESFAVTEGRMGMRRCAVNAALVVIQETMAAWFNAHLRSQDAGEENEMGDFPALSDAAEEGLLLRVLGLEQWQRQTHLEMDAVSARSQVVRRVCIAQKFLEGPNGSRAHRAAFDLFCSLLWTERALKEDGELERSAGAAADLRARGAVPRVLGRREQRAAVTEHVCSSTCISASRSATRSLLAELKHLCSHSEGTGVSAYPEENSNLILWMATVEGPHQTPWEGRRVQCALMFCPTILGGVWPTKPPQLRVRGPIPFHPNIDQGSGLVCMDLLGNRWSCAGGILAILISFRSLLASPTMSDAAAMPANLLAAGSFLQEPAEYEALNRRIAQDMPPI